MKALLTKAVAALILIATMTGCAMTTTGSQESVMDWLDRGAPVSDPE